MYMAFVIHENDEDHVSFILEQMKGKYMFLWNIYNVVIRMH